MHHRTIALPSKHALGTDGSEGFRKCGKSPHFQTGGWPSASTRSWKVQKGKGGRSRRPRAQSR